MAGHTEDSTPAKMLPALQYCAVQRDTLGHPLSVLMGHQGPVTYVDFNKVIPSALLSSSYDGTCRIWDVTSSGQAAHVMQATALFGPLKGLKGFTRFGGTTGLAMTGQANRPMTRQEVAEAVAAEASSAQNQVCSLPACCCLLLRCHPEPGRLMSYACCAQKA